MLRRRFAASMFFSCAAALSADPLVSTVEVELKVPHSRNAAGVSVWLAGTGGMPDLNERAKTDTTGRAVIHTRRTSFQYLVARRGDCDISIAGARRNLTYTGDWIRFRRGRMDLSALGTLARPDHMHASPEPALVMRKKTPGKAKFIFCLEDSLRLRHTLHPEHDPMPAGKVYVTGSWNNFNTALPDEHGLPADSALELFDDGSRVENSGDDLGADGVFTRVVDLPPGEHQYVFFVNGMHGSGAGFLTDPYEEVRRETSISTPYCSPLGGPPAHVAVRYPVSSIRVTGPGE